MGMILERFGIGSTAMQSGLSFGPFASYFFPAMTLFH
jgi:hypothetical protein